MDLSYAQVIAGMSLIFAGGGIWNVIKALMDRRLIGAGTNQTIVKTATDLATTLDERLDKVNGQLDRVNELVDRLYRERREQDDRIDAHLRWDRQARWLCDTATPPIVLGPAPPLYAGTAGDTIKP